MSDQDVITVPADARNHQPPHLAMLVSTYEDRTTGALYVHKDLEEVLKPWHADNHTAPIATKLDLGSVESWCDYVVRYSPHTDRLLLTWNRGGLKAILDYHTSAEEPGRCAWIATHTFRHSRQWDAWLNLAGGQAWSQKQLIEKLEDLSEDIKDPEPTALIQILRMLRSRVNTTAETELNADGSTRLTFAQTKNIATASYDLPASFFISIPVLQGHTTTTPDGLPTTVNYTLQLRLRPSVDDSNKLTFRLSLPQADQAYEDAVADQIRDAEKILRVTSPDYHLLREH